MELEVAFLDVLLMGFAAFYLSFVTVYTEGPGRMFERFRAIDFTRMTHCPYCLMPWYAASLILLHALGLGLVVIVFAIAGIGAALVHFGE